MTWLTGKRGVQYHWMLDLFRRLKLPLFDGMEEALRKANDERAKKLEKLKTDEFKMKREIEQEVRKQWLQEQETSHGYGNDELDFEAHDDYVQGVVVICCHKQLLLDLMVLLL